MFTNFVNLEAQLMIVMHHQVPTSFQVNFAGKSQLIRYAPCTGKIYTINECQNATFCSFRSSHYRGNES